MEVRDVPHRGRGLFAATAFPRGYHFYIPRHLCLNTIDSCMAWVDAILFLRGFCCLRLFGRRVVVTLLL